ncbi:MAG: hypothetical protein IMZ71_01200, partial [Chloroflexi bacterium]|nr:hypothetical protein [Chloroflexota bacterium]
MDNERKIEFWGGPDEERLTHTEMDCAIEDILDGMAMDVKNIKDLPETIEVCGFARTKLSSKSGEFWAEFVLEKLLEGLDEEYGDPDGSYSDPTDGMIKASEAFVAAVIDKYEVWACEAVERETVNVQEWIK